MFLFVFNYRVPPTKPRRQQLRSGQKRGRRATNIRPRRAKRKPAVTAGK